MFFERSRHYSLPASKDYNQQEWLPRDFLGHNAFVKFTNNCLMLFLFQVLWKSAK